MRFRDRTFIPVGWKRAWSLDIFVGHFVGYFVAACSIRVGGDFYRFPIYLEFFMRKHATGPFSTK